MFYTNVWKLNKLKKKSRIVNTESQLVGGE